MRVLLINQTFYPDVAATAQYGHDLARHLVGCGHEVTAIASRSMYGSAGAVLPADEMVDGIRIVRVGKSVFGKSSIAARVVDFALFYVAASWKAFTLPRHDVVVCFTTPPFIAIVGWLLRVCRGTRFVYWMMDVYPDVLVACGVASRRSPLTWSLDRLNRFCVRRSDRTVVLGRCMRDLLLRKGVPADRLELINVWADPAEFTAADDPTNRYRREWNCGDRLLVMYSGNFGIGHDVATIAAGVIALRDRDDVMFAFVGGGKRKAELLRLLRDAGVTNFVEADYQPRQRLGELLAAADVHLASLLPGAEGVMVPSKLYGVLATGRPVIYVGEPIGEVARAIEESGSGVVTPPGDGPAFAAAVCRLAENRAEARGMGERARESVIRTWGAGRALEQWRALIESLDSAWGSGAP